ncbi:MAG: O-methyltransferase [Acidimicrobiales bacterium]
MTQIANDEIEAYAFEHSSLESSHLAEVAARTRAEQPDSGMMVGRLEGGLLAMLVHALRPHFVLEIGAFTGYSALSMAAALGTPGRIVTCEVDPEHAAIARANFAASAYASQIELKEGPALETISSLPGPFDFVFIDADKSGYVEYYEAVLGKLARRGVIAADNTLWSGQVIDEADTSEDTRAVRTFNDKVSSDPRVRTVMLTVRDGLTLIRHAEEP